MLAQRLAKDLAVLRRFWYKLVLVGEAPLPITLPDMQAQLGGSSVDVIAN